MKYFIEFSNFLCRFFTKKRLNNKKKIMETRGIVLNGCYGGFSFSEEGRDFLTTKGMSPKRVHEIEYSHDPCDRMDPLLVSLVRNNPEVFSKQEFPIHCSSLYVREVPVDAIKADAVSIDEYDGLEGVEINWEKVALWKKSNEQTKKFATLEAAIIGEASKAEVMRLLEEFKKTILVPMPSKPVPDSEDEE